MSKLKFNDTTLFVLPIFGLPMVHYDTMGFINSFIAMEGREEKDPSIYMIFYDAPIHEEEMDNLIDMFPDLFIEKINYNEKLIITVFKIPEDYWSDYKTILTGKYSKLSEKYKLLVSDKPSLKPSNKDTKLFINGNKKRLQLMIIEKDPDCIEMVENMYDGLDISFADEVWKMFNKEDETLTLSKLEELSKQKITKKWKK